jgi:uncharacterized protein
MRSPIARALPQGDEKTFAERCAMVIGTLEAVRRYPVKSLRGVSLDCVTVDRSGIPGDRAGALFARHGARSGKPYRGKEHDRLHLFDDVAAAQEAARERGDELEHRSGEHFFDCAPVSILLDAWLEELNAHLGYRVEWERFRPNFFVRTPSTNGSPLENGLIDAQLTLGTVRLQVRCPIERCVTITYHPGGEPADARILQFIARERDAMMGVYCDVLAPGVARVGDPLIRV